MFGFIASVVLVMNLPMSWSRNLRHSTGEVMAPLQRVVGSVGHRARSTGRAVFGRGELVEENEQLKQENAELKRRVKDLESIERENLNLAQQLNFVQRSRRKLVAGKVIARDIGGWWRIVTIDCGKRSGIRDQQAVVTARGLVGKVVDVTANTADVLLISDPSCKASVRLETAQKSTGVLSGGGVSLRGKVRCQLSLIQRDVKVKREDRLITTGLGGVFPGGIDVGFIDSVELDNSGLFQRATVVPAVDLQGLSAVFVIVEEEGGP